MLPLSGKKKIAVLSIKWQNSEIHASIDVCKQISFDIKEFYETQSRNLLSIDTDIGIVSVPLDGTKQNLHRAELICKNKYKGYDYYAILNSLNAIEGKMSSNAGRGIAHLRGNDSRTAKHEIGHLFNLGHSGAYIYNTDGSILYDQYKDGYSVMSKYTSNTLASSQYYYLGWIKPEEIIMWSNNIKKYKLKRINDFNTKENSVVIISSNILEKHKKISNLTGSSAFISVVTNKETKELAIILHVSKDGSSRRIKLVNSEYYDDKFTGLRIKILNKDNNTVTFTVNF